MRALRTLFLFAAASLFAVPLSCLAQKNNDMTKSAAGYSKRYRTQDSMLGDKKSQFQDSRFEKKSFVDSDKTSRFGGMKSRVIGDKNFPDSGKAAPDASKKFSVPEYKGSKGEWRGGSDKANFKNADRNLTKTYSGKIDIAKRNREYQDFVEKYYGSLTDRSMEDINKYYSRAPKEGGADIVKKAGGKISGEDEEGFFDFLSPRAKRQPVRFTGVEKKIRPPKPEAQETKPAQTNSHAPQVRAPESAPRKRVSQTPENREVVEQIDAEKAKRINFLNIPDQFRSNATIKVKVKE